MFVNIETAVLTFVMIMSVISIVNPDYFLKQNPFVSDPPPRHVILAVRVVGVTSIVFCIYGFWFAQW